MINQEKDDDFQKDEIMENEQAVEKPKIFTLNSAYEQIGGFGLL